MVNISESAAQEAFKKAMGNYPTGVTVVTTFNNQREPVGLTVNSFASVSLDPLLILWSIDKKSSSYQVFLEAEKFAVNILADDQADLCTIFSSKIEDRFSQCDWRESDRELPLLDHALSQLECQTVNKIHAGDHVILIGKVLHIHNENKEPLLYHRRNLGPIPSDFYQ